MKRQGNKIITDNCNKRSGLSSRKKVDLQNLNYLNN